MLFERNKNKTCNLGCFARVFCQQKNRGSTFLIIIIQFLKARSPTAIVMDNAKSFKHPVELREYWRLEKRKQRDRTRGAKEAKTEQSEKNGGGKRSV